MFAFSFKWKGRVAWRHVARGGTSRPTGAAVPGPRAGRGAGQGAERPAAGAVLADAEPHRLTARSRRHRLLWGLRRLSPVLRWGLALALAAAADRLRQVLSGLRT